MLPCKLNFAMFSLAHERNRFPFIFGTKIDDLKCFDKNKFKSSVVRIDKNRLNHNYPFSYCRTLLVLPKQQTTFEQKCSNINLKETCLTEILFPATKKKMSIHPIYTRQYFLLCKMRFSCVLRERN